MYPCTHSPLTVLMPFLGQPLRLNGLRPERQQGLLSLHVYGSAIITPTLYVDCADDSSRNKVTTSEIRAAGAIKTNLDVGFPPTLVFPSPMLCHHHHSLEERK
jgi:hypothetical protein